jgi:glyoxylase-like metal-dependent hydrolase (beta-lactamase superfamily II)
MKRWFPGVLLVGGLLLQGAALPAQPSGQERALQAVQASYEAYGGKPADDGLRLSLTVRSDSVNEGQSHTAEAPFERYPNLTEAKVDRPAGRSVLRTDSSIAGDFRFSEWIAVQNGKGFAFTPEMKTYREVTAEPPVLNRFLPHRLLQPALQNPAALQWVGEEGGLDVVSLALPERPAVRLHLDRTTRLLRKYEQRVPFGVYGDGVRELEFEGYRKIGGLMLPSRMTVRNRNAVHGATESTYLYEKVTTEPVFDPKDFELPAGAVKEDYSYRGSFAVKPLAKDVYLLENVTAATGQWSYNVLVVVLADSVLVAEAPVSSAVSDSVLAKVREIAPGKPVRYLVQSHHHGDHLGGIRSYIAEGTTILAGAGTAGLIEKIAKAPFELAPDRLQKEPRAPKIEVVKGSRTIRSGDREVVIHDIGPSPHAKDMLFVYLPQERILYQADLVNEGEYPENETTRHFQARLKALGLEVKTLAGLHGKVRMPN